MVLAEKAPLMHLAAGGGPLYNFLISLGLILGVTALAGFLLGGAQYGIAPGVLGGVIAYWLLARRSFKRVELLSREVGGIMEAAGRKVNLQRQPKQQEAVMQAAIDQAIKKLRGAYAIASWQWGIRAQMDGQIGQLLFMGKRFDRAKPYLKDGFARVWTTRAILGVCHFKGQAWEAMNSAFAESEKHNKKQGMLYAVWAWCVLNAKDGRKSDQRRDHAIEILARGEKKTESKDPLLQKNLEALRNGRSMRMQGYGNQWYMFHLERPRQAQTRQVIRGR
jgi:hypothetical protein